MPIVERLVNSLMMNGRNNGKKQLAVRIVQHACEIIHLLTDQNPVQVSYSQRVKCCSYLLKYFRLLLTLSLTLVHVKIQPESVLKVLSVVKPLMFHLYVVLTKLLLLSLSVLENQLSVTLNQLVNV